MDCQICGKQKIFKFLSLGLHPPADNFLSEQELGKSEPRFPLDLFFCEKCKLVQLGHIADPKILFTDHFVYTTGSSNELVKNFQSLVDELINRFKVSEKDFVVDIGSNDGTLLKNYLSHKISVLGVDPSRAARIAIENGIPTMLDFFNEQTAQTIFKTHKKAKIITATNVFAHVKDLGSLLNGIKLLLDDDGVFVEESHYLPNLVFNMQYDSIYAEHLRYYSLKPLVFLFKKFGLEVFDAQEISTHGGSLRVFVCKKGKQKISKNVKKILGQEKKKGLYSKKTFKQFAKRIAKNRQKLRALLQGLKAKNSHIVGIGAPAKGNTLLNYCGIGNDILDYLVEKQNLKIGKYSPGMHIKVVEETQLFKDQPEYALLLAWNMKDTIIPKLKNNGFKGKIIVPIPAPVVV